MLCHRDANAYCLQDLCVCYTMVRDGDDEAHDVCTVVAWAAVGRPGGCGIFSFVCVHVFGDNELVPVQQPRV